MRGRGLVALVVAIAVGLLSSQKLSVAAAPLGALVSARTGAADLALDEVVMKATHNSYAQAEPLFDQLVYHRVRSLELDIHGAKAGAAAPEGDWLVYHADVPLFRETSCELLSSCLGQIRAFHDAVPRHDVVTVFVDLKDSFAQGHSPAELDRALVAGLGRDALVTPAELLARCPGAATLREAVTGACGFPALGELRGKVIVAVTGGGSCDPDSPLSQYASGPSALARRAFLAPDLNASCPMAAYEARPEAIFFNVALRDRERVRDVRARGLMARLYDGVRGGLDSAVDLAAAAEAGAQILATDRVNADADAWSTTASAHGGPFGCQGCDDLAEPANIISVSASTGSVEGGSDSFLFAPHEGGAGGAAEEPGRETWSSFVSVPSSHVEPRARACLMARASEAPGAPHVALCRALDSGAPTIIVRAAAGAAPTTTTLGALAGFSAETPAFLRLDVTPHAEGTRVRGEVSLDGQTWRTLAVTSVPASLPLRGIAVASGGGPVRALFGNLTRTAHDGAIAIRATSLLAKRIGVSAYGFVADGVAR